MLKRKFAAPIAPVSLRPRPGKLGLHPHDDAPFLEFVFDHSGCDEWIIGNDAAGVGFVGGVEDHHPAAQLAPIAILDPALAAAVG